MTARELFDIWSPRDARWSPWVKPVLFSQVLPVDLAGEWVGSDEAIGLDAQGAVVVDLPGEESIAVGLQLARGGHRPVPLFNACPAPPGVAATVNVRPILRSLIAAAPLLKEWKLPPEAPPAFLLDARRRISEIVRSPGVFDNRSLSLPTDFPSATRLLACGIRQVILIQGGTGEPQPDLSHTLLRWQQAGLPILRYGSPPEPITVQRPLRFRTLLYHFLATWRLRRSPLGGFGGRLPAPGGG